MPRPLLLLLLRALLALAVLACCACWKKKDPSPSPDAAPSASVAAVASSAPSSVAPAPEPEPTASPERTASPEPIALDGGVSVTSGASLERWVKARAAAAKAGKPELVRVPLVRHGPGWGCICPEHFLGVDATSAGDRTVWITPKFAPTAPELPPDSVVIVEGYFTGRAEPFDPKTGEAFDRVTLHELEVLRHRPPTAHDSDMPVPEQDLVCSVLLEGKEARKEAPPPADGNGHLLVAASIPVSDPRASAQAEKKKAELIAKGFTTAEVIESRRVPGLFCCHLVVVASRHATDKDARAAALAAKAKGIPVLVRRGW